MSSDPPSAIEQQLRFLTERVWLLEDALRRHGIAIDRPVSTQQGPVPAPNSPPNIRPEAPAPRTRVVAQDSLESRIGSQWFNRIGILAVLVGMSWFLKFAVDNRWITPRLRELIGILAGVGLLAWSERFRARGYAGFSYSLKAIGSGILYLTLWAAFALFHLVPAPMAFAGMMLVTLYNGLLAWRQDSEWLAFYGILGGFLTPTLLSAGQQRPILLFSYLLLLNAAVLMLVRARSWGRLLFASFAGTVFYGAAWWMDVDSLHYLGITFAFFTAFFLLFAVAPVLAHFDEGGLFVLRTRSRPSFWDRAAASLLPVANAAVSFVGLALLLRSSGMASWQAWLALAFSAVYAALRFGPHALEVRRSSLLRDLHLATAIVFLTIAVPLAMSGPWLTIAWFSEGAALLWPASRARSSLPRIMAYCCVAIALLALLSWSFDPVRSVLLNRRLVTYVYAIAVCGFSAWIALRTAATAPPELRHAWRNTASAMGLIVSALILLAISLEIHTYWTPAGTAHRVTLGEQFSYSALMMLYGAVVLTVGFSRRSAFLRWQALVLLAGSIAKVFLIDESHLSEAYRIVSFLGLGVLLLAVSFVYQRDWFNLRNSRAD